MLLEEHGTARKTTASCFRYQSKCNTTRLDVGEQRVYASATTGTTAGADTVTHTHTHTHTHVTNNSKRTGECRAEDRLQCGTAQQLSADSQDSREPLQPLAPRLQEVLQAPRCGHLL
jgi:hypothetical protein